MTLIMVTKIWSLQQKMVQYSKVTCMRTIMFIYWRRLFVPNGAHLTVQGKATHPPPVSHADQDHQRYRQLDNCPKWQHQNKFFFVKYALFFFKFSFLYRQLCNQKRPWLWNPLQLVPHGYWTQPQLSTGPVFCCNPCCLNLHSSPSGWRGGVGWGIPQWRSYSRLGAGLRA